MASAFNRTISLFVAAAAGAAFVYFAMPMSTSPVVQSTGKESAQPASLDPIPQHTTKRDLVLDELVRKMLVELNVNEDHIGRGIYRLKAARWRKAPTRSLIDFELPRSLREDQFWSTLIGELKTHGYEMAPAKNARGKQRAHFRAVFKEGVPVLILRAYPSGPRVSIVVDGVGHEPGLVTSLLELDEDVTFSVDSEGAFAPLVTKALVAQNREVIAHVPLADAQLRPETKDGNSAVEMAQVDEVLDEALKNLQLTSGIDTRPIKGQEWSATDLDVLLSSIGQRGYFLFDRELIPEQHLETLTHQTGARVGQRTHSIRGKDSIANTLKGLDSTLAYAGTIHLSVQATPTVLAALKPWLKSLRQRNVAIMRLSEIVK